MKLYCGIDLYSSNNVVAVSDEQDRPRQIQPHDDYQLLQSIPGVGPVPGTTIVLETGTITRFASPGNYASYARCVKSEKISNGKRKGQGNKKNGNKYLAWAFIEAAHYARSGVHRSSATISPSSQKAISWSPRKRWPTSWLGRATTGSSAARSLM